MSADGPEYGGHSMVAPLRRVLMKRPEEAFRSTTDIEAEWQGLGYVRRPNFDAARQEHQRFARALADAGVEVLTLPADRTTTLDSIYTHDPMLITDRGAVILQTGKPLRRGEGDAMRRALEAWHIPVLGSLDGDATAEAGDMIWLDGGTLAVGRGFRTNESGIRRLGAFLEPLGVEVLEFHLPYGNGPSEILHLMSFISLVDHDLAVVYRRLLPVPLYEVLIERGFSLVDVPDEEYVTQATNVLAIAPRRAVMLSGNPVTRTRLEEHGCRVTEIDGAEICIPGAGGPTCLTRPIWRRECSTGHPTTDS